MEEKTLKAIKNLLLEDDFNVFLSWLCSEEQQLSNLLVSVKEEVPFRWMQGRCQQLKDLIAVIKSAPVEHERVQQKRRTPYGSANENTSALRKEESWT